MILKTLLPAMVLEKESNLMIDRNSFDMATGCWINRRIVIRDGVRVDLMRMGHKLRRCRS